ncbi:MAG: hypothetical protein LUD39_06740 [Opitutae bacterium]|nr:hypothetical protein [Opitutae bacterium]MCD8299427.1 hypothetical protein [Opitutae bacterium]
MKISKLSLVAPFAAAFALAATGCNGWDTDYHGESVRAEHAHNVLGIIDVSPGSYGYIDDSQTVVLDTDSLWCRRDFSGAKILLFWGAISIRDY